MYYRLYVLARPDGHFVGFEEFEADDDVAAVRVAQTHLDEKPLELWCGKRKVKSFSPKVPAGEREPSRQT